ncbi:maintenance of mitochondrial morphology protein 1 [Suillus clintonianus]|uniref:maintenance of mitochondrial morphology protein 1 n=1 Tax=Suillus clintonianus TaxID=1904413 RepID=UPI001B877D58|nr:maintenance of mitochondrial morphology protein 1 [Suillus clintonianus]KAG2129922.1 maintenance of mitochondrial morphology protein 1 [Suillus clintonianus]
MGNNYIFSLTPTFTQGLVLGQLSILVLLALVLKYLFFVSPESEKETGPFHPLSNSNPSWHQDAEEDDTENAQENESAHWFNILARQVVDVYRAKLQNNLTGYEGIEVARRTIEDHANEMRPRGFLDHITVHSVDLGMSAPKLSNARVVNDNRDSSLTTIEFDMSYTDTISVSLSTSYLFNYPMSSFARLPVSLTISLSLFESKVTLVPPSPASAAPVLTISLPQDFTLNLKTTSLMGSRAMLRDVPKLHELIEYQVRKVLALRGTWKVVLPGVGSLATAQHEVEKEQAACNKQD